MSHMNACLVTRLCLSGSTSLTSKNFGVRKWGVLLAAAVATSIKLTNSQAIRSGKVTMPWIWKHWCMNCGWATKHRKWMRGSSTFKKCLKCGEISSADYNGQLAESESKEQASA